MLRENITKASTSKIRKDEREKRPRKVSLIFYSKLYLYLLQFFLIFEVILGLQKSCKTNSLLYVSIASPNVNILHNHNTVIETKQLL